MENDAANKRVIVPLQSLKLAARVVNGTARGEYQLRYRVISEDKNTFSEWSPIYKIIAPTVATLISPLVTINSIYTRVSANLATINWEIPPILSTIQEYDLYVKWGSFSGGTVTFPTGAEYEYYGSFTSNRLDIIKPTTKASFTGANFLLQRSTFPKIVVPGAKVFELTNRQF
jgi:hypothetical protein